jgi:hypothetical protein
VNDVKLCDECVCVCVLNLFVFYNFVIGVVYNK